MTFTEAMFEHVCVGKVHLLEYFFEVFVLNLSIPIFLLRHTSTPAHLIVSDYNEDDVSEQKSCIF